MKINHSRAILGLCLLIMLAFLISATLAKDYQVGAIYIVAPFSRALPPTSKNGAVYLTLANHGHQPDQLIGAASPIAEHAEIHTHRVEDGVMKMTKVDKVELPPNEEVEFVPGGNHIMLVGLSRPLKEGETFPLMLHLKNAGHSMVEVMIEAVDATSSSHDKHDHDNAQTHQAVEESKDHDQGTSGIQVHLTIEGGKVAENQGVIRVTQGDDVTLYFSTDELHHLHFHGYDIEVEVGPTLHAMMNFKANATGRFPVEAHGSNSHHALFYIEVYPK